MDTLFLYFRGFNELTFSIQGIRDLDRDHSSDTSAATI